MPFDVVTHIWDVFLYKGWSIVLQVIIALFKIYESMQLLSFAPFLFMIEEILGTDDEEELRNFFKDLPDRVFFLIEFLFGRTTFLLPKSLFRRLFLFLLLMRTSRSATTSTLLMND